ncbi:hypothetical protein K493DRAFT_404256 [Basidiobolus meristosporus CBS 931.73]|uniref:Zn(2)-C6 fungal-type domain-containing protein n=1 Tax=Basidiobolus meristosporus CBS 931.73 TaxID=1314790 RepID=A0A1Y1Z5R7_9FUNG|nr:hypothetical protein K493DRAFT_404256 [Basidiobolus meristosporus CBS 931.73]|eukprot:ORY05611.1 hypothetical protein K493DRAFT_404256 [Basidiobolus meristosporus CBS 931.73]
MIESTPTDADKKKRLTQACDRCRKMKVKCDAAKPACSTCHRLKVACTFLTGNKRRGPRQNIMESLSFLSGSAGNFRHAVLKMDGGKIVELASSNNAQKNQAKRKKEKLKNGKAGLSEQSKYRFCLQSVQPGESSSKRMRVTSLDTLSDDSSTRDSPLGSEENSSGVGDDVQQLIALYFERIHQHIPIVHPSFLEDKIEENSPGKILLQSMCAISCRYMSNDSSDKSGESFRDEVQSKLLEYCDEPSIELIQALLIMCFYEISRANFNKSSLYIGMATRIAQGMGIHKIDEQQRDISQLRVEKWIQLETKRRVWWSCFLFDRVVSLESGRPWGINEDEFCVMLPCDDYSWETQTPVEGQVLRLHDEFPVVESPNTRAAVSPFSHFIALIVLLGRISKFSSGYEKRPDTDREETFELLKTALTFWENNLPPDMQFSKETSVANDPSSSLITLMHAFKHTSKILLHLPRLKKLSDRSSKTITMSSVESAKYCFNEAKAIIGIIQDLPSTSGDQIKPFFDFCVFVAARFFLIGCRCKSPAQSNKSLVCLNLLIKALKEMSTLWRLSDMYSRFLENHLARLNDISVPMTQPVISVEDCNSLTEGNMAISNGHGSMSSASESLSPTSSPISETPSLPIVPDLTIYSNLINAMAESNQCPVLHAQSIRNLNMPVGLETLVNCMPEETSQSNPQMMFFNETSFAEHPYVDPGATYSSASSMEDSSVCPFSTQNQLASENISPIMTAAPHTPNVAACPFSQFHGANAQMPTGHPTIPEH